MEHRTARIFLVEDSSDDEYFIRRAMSRLFPTIEIEVASNGFDAVQRISDPEFELPDLMLVDIRLPRVNGLEVLEAIRANPRFTSTPVVMLTSSDERSDIDGAYARGANGYVRKPVQFDEYVERFTALLHYWLKINSN